MKRISLKKLVRQFRDTAHAFRRQIGIPSLGILRRLPDKLRILTSEIDRLNRDVDNLIDEKVVSKSGSIHQSDPLHWLIENQSAAAIKELSSCNHSDELVSVVLLTRQPNDMTCRAIESVLRQSHPNWELLIPCGQSGGIEFDYLKAFTNDARIRLFDSQAFDLKSEANGDVIAWVEEHNVWYSYYLSSVLQRMETSGAESLSSAQCVELQPGGEIRVQGAMGTCRSDQVSLLPAPSVFAHHRRLLDEIRGDCQPVYQLVPQLIACSRQKSSARNSMIGSWCQVSSLTGLSDGGFDAYYRYRTQYLLQEPISKPLKVLYAVWNFPQITESYVRWEIECFRRWGVEIEVWSEYENVESPYPTDVPVHNGSLEDAIQTVQPQLIHFHWLNIAENHLDVIMRSAIPTTVRGHGYEFNASGAQSLIDHATIHKIFLFPHYADHFKGRPKVVPLKSAFYGKHYYPEFNKEARLVVRTGSGKSEKGSETFIDAALACPHHRFVLILGRLPNLGHCIEEIQEYNRKQGSPVEIHVNMPTEEVAKWIRKAGIYLHTYGTEEPFGMPISIVESMATGCFVLVRNLPGAKEYVGPAGRLYNTTQEAIDLILSTLQWYPGQWAERQRISIEHAHQQHGDVQVLRPILDSWLQAVEMCKNSASYAQQLAAPQLQPAFDYLLKSAQSFEHEQNYGGPYLAHIAETYQTLKGWNEPTYLQLAGFLHSIHAPWAGQPARIFPSEEQKGLIVEAIGEKAANLVYLFGAIPRHDFVQSFQKEETPHRFFDRFTHTEIELDEATFRDLCLIHTAEWLEKRDRLARPLQNVAGYANVAKFLGGVAEETFQKQCFPEHVSTQSAIPTPHTKFFKVAEQNSVKPS